MKSFDYRKHLGLNRINYAPYYSPKDWKKKYQEKGRILRTYRNYMRECPTKAEWGLKKYLEWRKLKFSFQKVLGNYIYDFCFKKQHILVEIDGSYHNSEKQKLKDYKKEKFAKRCGYKLLRFKNEDVYNNIKYIYDMIKKEFKIRKFKYLKKEVSKICGKN